MATVTRISRADRKAQTREKLVDAAYAVFTRQGFHRSSLDQVAAEAGFTKGAVYSNFASKEDLFFAVYERRVAQGVAEAEALIERLGLGAPQELARRVVGRRRAGDDGWLAVFFEFWAHVLRHPELRERFLELHARGRAPLVAATREWTAREGIAMDPDRWTQGVFALVTGIGLEQLTDPGLDGPDVISEMLERLMGG